MKRAFSLIVLLSILILGGRWTTSDALQMVDFPSIDNLPIVATLPNPFRKTDGSQLKTQAEWEQQHEYIKAMLQHYMYGHMPPPPKNLMVEELSSESVYNGSGCGGAGCYRLRGPAPNNGKAQGLGTRGGQKGLVYEFPHWFHPRLQTFSEKEDQIPFDLHFLRAAIAPRAVISIDGLTDHWANPMGTQSTYTAAKPVFDFLGVPEKLGIYYREGGHGQTADDWGTLMDFADFIFFDKKSASGKRFDQVPFPNLSPAFNWKTPARSD